MSTAQVSFLSLAERLVELTDRSLIPGQDPFKYTTARFVLDRLLSFALFSPAASLDLLFHSACIFPAVVYAAGKSIWSCRLDFTLPWQHLQRVQNAVSPLLFGSFFSLVHPLAAMALIEPADKHAALGILSSNTVSIKTPCSPIRSLSIVQEMASEIPEVFPEEYVKALDGAIDLEKSLEILQAQEFIHRTTNLTLHILMVIWREIDASGYSRFTEQLVLRILGLLIPLLTCIDFSIALAVQAFFLITGAMQLFIGRGPIYTEMTKNPLMHATFLIQNILKTLGNLLSFPFWFISPALAFGASVIPSHLFFQLQMYFFMLQVRWKMYWMKEEGFLIIPIVYQEGACSPITIPMSDMHKTYLIVKKQKNGFDLLWVDRPDASLKANLNAEVALERIEAMIVPRFPFMQREKLTNYPVKSTKPTFPNMDNVYEIELQGGLTNCVVSNLFGTFRQLDRLSGKSEAVAQQRALHVRSYLQKHYDFMRDDFTPFPMEDGLPNLKEIWKRIENGSEAPL